MNTLITPMVLPMCFYGYVAYCVHCFNALNNSQKGYYIYFYHFLWSHVRILDSDWLKTAGYETTTLSCLKETFWLAYNSHMGKA